MEHIRPRKVQRVTLLQPVPAHADGERAYVVDASVHGVRLSHTNLFSQGAKYEVAFEWNGKPIEFVGQIRWTKAQRAPSNKNIYQSGFEISSIRNDSASALRNLVQSYVEGALAAQKENARGIPPSVTRLVPNRPGLLFSRYELVNGLWRKTMTSDTRQPPSGFTVSANESRHQVELLQLAYASADPKMRDTIRKLAEISVSEAVPARRRYMP